MDDELFFEAEQWAERRKRDGELYGTLGRSIAGVYEFKTSRGTWYVTLDNGTIDECINNKTVLKPIPVILKRNRAGQLEVTDLQVDKALEMVSGDHRKLSTLLTPIHDHSIAGGNPDPVESRRFMPGLLHASSGLTVYIEGFAYRWNGQDKRWLGGSMNLLTPVDYRPSTASTHAWVKVGIDPETNTPVAIEGDEYPLAVTLTSDQLDAIDFATDNYIPVGGVQLSQGQTDSPLEDDFMEARQIINAGAGATFNNIQTDANGDVQVDANGNVIYV